MSQACASLVNAGPTGNTRAMGLNPFRQENHSVVDYLVVAGAIIVTLLLVAWAAFG